MGQNEGEKKTQEPTQSKTQSITQAQSTIFTQEITKSESQNKAKEQQEIMKMESKDLGKKCQKTDSGQVTTTESPQQILFEQPQLQNNVQEESTSSIVTHSIKGETKMVVVFMDGVRLFPKSFNIGLSLAEVRKLVSEKIKKDFVFVFEDLIFEKEDEDEEILSNILQNGKELLVQSVKAQETTGPIPRLYSWVPIARVCAFTSILIFYINKIHTRTRSTWALKREKEPSM